VIAQAAPARQVDELFAVGAGQAERVGQRGDGPMLGAFTSAAFHVRQRPGADSRGLGELLQRQTYRVPMATQHLGEAGCGNRVLLLHGPVEILRERPVTLGDAVR
jgi:hypothetical protein